MSITYRKIPDDVQVVKFDGTEDAMHEIKGWAAVAQVFYELYERKMEVGGKVCYHRVIRLGTSHGVVDVRMGDYVVKDVLNYIYPVNAKLFAKTFTPSGNRL